MGHEKLYTGVGMLGMFAGAKSIRDSYFDDDTFGLVTSGIGAVFFVVGLWGILRKHS
ncbi:MAG: hypothetical protein AAB439_01755 [Patescibacteria group bacterium]